MQRYKPNIRELTLEHGISYPSDKELLMLMLGSGTKEISVEKLSKFVEKRIVESNQEELVKNLVSIKGMGIGKALSIAAAIEFGRRKNSHNNARIINPKDIVPFVKAYSMQPQEYFVCITLNGGHEILQIRVVSIGTINKAIVHPREVFSEALKENAAAIIVCHNHPSGNCEPSEDDINTTRVLMKAADILGISLLDHVIFDKNSYFSFVEHNLLFTQ